MMVGLVEPSLDKKPAVRSEDAICKAIEEILKKVQGITVSEREGKKGSIERAFRWCYVTRLIQEMPRPFIRQPAGCPSIKEDWCKI